MSNFGQPKDGNNQFYDFSNVKVHSSFSFSKISLLLLMGTKAVEGLEGLEQPIGDQ